MQELVVAKFGGTSLADAAQVRKVIDIVRADPRRKVVVVSAPGKRSPNDAKVTDLLYERDTAKVIERFKEIALGLEVTVPSADFETLSHLKGDLLVSRGEYLMGKILAEALHFVFLDPAEFICFDKDGRFDMDATRAKSGVLIEAAREGVVVPGFYGAMPDGTIKTFSRGGSDITGAIIAALLNATLYENWTDVSGTLMADPRVVQSPALISSMTYQEMLELAYAGASVLHDEAIFPARKARIPINIRNTNAPHEAGTLIIADEKAPPPHKGSITGIAARKGFTSVRVAKAGMGKDVGYVWSILGILKELNISWEHMPSRIESISLIISDDELKGKIELLRNRIETECAPDKVSVRPGLALVCIVGRGMAQVPGMLAKFAASLAEASINIYMVDQDDGEISMLAAVDDSECEKAVRASYAALVTQ